MSALVDTHETERTALLHLSMHDAVGGGDVGVSCCTEARGTDLVGYGFSAEPVAVVVRVAGVHHDGHVLVDEFEHVLDRGDFSSVVPRGAERCADGVG